MLWQTQTIFGAHCAFRTHNKQKTSFRKYCSTQWNMCGVCSDKIDLLIACLFAALQHKCQSCFLRSGAHLRRSSHPDSLLRHISRLPTASVSTHSGTHARTHTHTHTHKSPRAFSHMHTKAHAQSWQMCTCTHTLTAPTQANTPWHLNSGCYNCMGHF